VPRQGGGGGMTEVDGGTSFGTWNDPTSRLIYHDAMPTLLSGLDRRSSVLDLGGGNGLIREWFADVTTVDSDRTKEPDVVADALTYVPTRPHDLVLLRYVAHYLDDHELTTLMRHIARYHDGILVIIQFVNTDIKVKQFNSVHEMKYFRTEPQLRNKLRPWRPFRRIAVGYQVDPEFYRNRLGHPNPVGHPETVVSYLCEVPT
jgi:hypothetical protein